MTDGTVRPEDLLPIRDLISHSPLQPMLMTDLSSWHRLCDGLDGITDAPDIGGRVAALDAVRRELGMDTTSGDADGAALVAGLAAVRTELEERVRRHYAAFATEPLARHLEPPVGYFLEKAAEAVGAMTPNATQYDREKLGYNRAGLDTLADRLTAVDEGLAARGFGQDDRRDVRDALYICRRAQVLLDGAPDAPDPTDADLLVQRALPALVERVRALAAEVDADYASPPSGWSPPSRADD